MLLALCEVLNTVLSFAGKQCPAVSFIGGTSLLPLLVLYLISYVFHFCEYHRMFLHYTAAVTALNIYDFYFHIPVCDKTLFHIHCIIIGVFFFLILYFYRKEKCCKR